MLRSLLILSPSTLLLLYLASLCAQGRGRPHHALEGSLEANGMDSQKALLLEAVKTGILSSLGMDREPRLTQRASEDELRRMYQLYWEKMREMGGNSSQTTGETRSSTMSTVLFPASVEVIRKPQRGEPVQWYRAVFHKNPSIQAELMLARAELKVSRQILEKPTSARHERRRQIKVRVNKRKLSNSDPWTHMNSEVHDNVSTTQHVMLDISPEVDRWMRSDGGQRLVVDVGVVMGQFEEGPTISLELGLRQSWSSRQRRSQKEDDCDEQGLCCRKSAIVSFKEIGWTDWVVAPTEYVMHFCDGACPHNFKPASMHTQVKSRLHLMSKGGVPQPCCVPATYEPMVLMHYDSRGKLKLTPFNDLIVSKCHCA